MSSESEAAVAPDTALFQAYRRTGDRRLRDLLVEEHLGLAEAMATRYHGRGVARDDLVQVATIGLIKAVSRFDPDHGAAFSSFAVPTILGELRHHFRDHGWTVNVPRRLQELRRRADATAESLAQDLGREPTACEVAASLGEEQDNVLLALEGLRTAYAPATLDTGTSDTLRDPGRSHEHVETRMVVADLLEDLPSRQRRIVHLRFWHDLSQQQIADRVGCSQMHVSRLLRRSLEQMQDAVGDPQLT